MGTRVWGHRAELELVWAPARMFCTAPVQRREHNLTSLQPRRPLTEEGVIPSHPEAIQSALTPGQLDGAVLTRLDSFKSEPINFKQEKMGPAMI